jgi:hypothetical protein
MMGLWHICRGGRCLSSGGQAFIAYAKAKARRKPEVAFFPSFSGPDELLDAAHKAAFFLPSACVRRVALPTTFEPSFGEQAPASWPRPSYLADASIVNRVRMECVRGSDAPADADWLLVWQAGAAARVPPGLRNTRRIIALDRHVDNTDGWTWCGLVYEQMTEWERRKMRSDAQRRFNRFCGNLPRYKRCYVFGTGPSLDEAWRHDFSDGYRIVCNTMVANPALLDHIQPHFITAGDAVHHFDLNLHAWAFQQDLVKALKARDMLFVTRDLFVPLFMHHHPSAAPKTVAAPLHRGPVHFDLARRLVYHEMGNIFTSMMLPLASFLADEIYMLGFDGRAPGAERFWRYSNQSAYEALKPAIAEAHPAFFARMDYEAYNAMHNKNIESVCSAGESMGKQYVCMCPSHLSALQRRYQGMEPAV